MVKEAEIMLKGMNSVHEALVIQKVPEVPKPKRSLLSILEELERLENATQEELINAPMVVDDLNEKVDDYKAIDQLFDFEIEKLASKIKDINERKQSLMRKKDSLRERLAYVMNEKKWEKLPGKYFKIALVKTKGVEFSLPKADSDQYIKNYELIDRETTYSWKTSEVKKLLLLEPEKYKDFGKVFEKSHVTFTVNKDLKK